MFLDYVSKHFDPTVYLRERPDAGRAGTDPLQHYLDIGVREGRRIAAEVQIRPCEADRIYQPTMWRVMQWRGRTFAANDQKVPNTVLTQVNDQARHEDALWAPGFYALPNLRKFESADLWSRDSVDLRRVLAEFEDFPDTVVLVQWLVVGGAEKYAADLVDALLALKERRIYVIVTGQTASSAAGWEELSILLPFHDVKVVFWRDVAGRVDDRPEPLARLLAVLRPKEIVVVNSNAGLNTVAQYGRALSQHSKLFCAYFSMGLHGVGVPYGTYFPRRTALYAKTLTDNRPMAAKLEERTEFLGGAGVALLPPRLLPVDSATFERRTKRLLNDVARPERTLRRWLWIGRIEPFKGTEILKHIAAIRTADTFHLFGPADENAKRDLAMSHNVFHEGSLVDVASADFSGYHGFLFTSLFEGMPNIVLEMSQHALPLILSDVGGIKDTFDPNAAKLIPLASQPEACARGFSEAMDQIVVMSSQELEAMVRHARDQALACHGPAVYQDHVDRLFS